MNIANQVFRGLPAWAAAVLLAGCASEPATPRVVFTGLAINGRPVQMMLDTGAASTVLYSTAAKRAGLNFTVPRPAIPAGAFEIVAGMSEPARVTMGSQAFTTRLPVFSVPPSQALRSRALRDGVIGWPEVRDNILLFDAADSTVLSVAQLPQETSEWLKLKVRPHDTLLLETPLSDGKTGLILVDTGAPQGVQLAPEQWQETRAAHPEAPVNIVNHSTWSTGSFAARAMWANEIKLGALTLTGMPVENMPPSEAAWITKACPGAEVAGVIGLAALNRVDLVVDGENGFAYLRPKRSNGSPLHGGAGDWRVAENVRLSCDHLLVRSGIDECSSGNFDAAIADYSRALAINPKNAEAYANRALARLEKGDSAGAASDDTCALEFDPKNPGIYAGRALARQILGAFSGAVSDYDKVIELSAGDSPGARLHRQILLRRLGRPEAEGFAKNVAAWKDGWSKSLGLFVAGQLDEQGLLAAVEKKDGKPALNQQCEAFYYIGMERLFHGDKAGAQEFFQRAVGTGVRGYIEYQFANAELARLNRPAP